MFRGSFLGIALLFCVGCVSTPPSNSSQQTLRGPCPDEPGGWCPFVQDIAKKTWRYAQFSQNAYAEGRYRYSLPVGYTQVRKHPNDSIGFAYEIFDRIENGELVERVIAFRGTEGADFDDWWHGNLLGRQNRSGLELVRGEFEALRANGHDDVPIVVTGHSLGGGIAHHVSLRHVEIESGETRSVAGSYVFNNSPRYWQSDHYPEVDRASVVESGEILFLLRWPSNEATQRYVRINCKRGLRPIFDHTMEYLADCLTWIAAHARTPDPHAVVSVEENGIQRPDTELQD